MELIAGAFSFIFLFGVGLMRYGNGEKEGCFMMVVAVLIMIIAIFFGLFFMFV